MPNEEQLEKELECSGTKYDFQDILNYCELCRSGWQN